MVLILAPDWFLGFDVAIEAFSFVILFIFFLLSIRNYKINKNRNLLYLGIGFFLIALAQLFSILTRFTLYYNVSLIREVGQLIIHYHVLKSTDILYNLGFFFNRFLTLMGLYLIYKLHSKERTFFDFTLIIYFVFVLSWMSPLNSPTYYLYHITVLILIGLIIRDYILVYKKNGDSNTMTLIVALIVLFLGHLNFIFSAEQAFYATGYILGLASYTILLVLMIRLLKYNKKYRSNSAI